MGRVPLHGLDQVGDEVVAPLELGVDVGPRLIRADAQADQGVVETDGDQDDQDDETENDPEHGASLG